MTDKVVVVGPGRLGLALGAALLETGAVDRLLFYGRTLEPPPHPVFESGRAGYRLGPHPLPDDTTILILAVPDGALAEVAQEIAMAGPAPAGCVALHLSGALSTDVLAPLNARGYVTGSLHPLQSIADPWAGGSRLVGITFAAAGEPAALSVARRVASVLKSRVVVVAPVLRPIYHAAATMASNYLVTLTATAVRLLGKAGVGEVDALAALLPLMRGTLDNLQDLGVAGALTGPIARGDADTVRLHLARLSPEERSLYCALGRETLHLARGAGLDPERALELEALLSD